MNNANAYTLHFSDGKRCTMIDPDGEPMAELEAGLKEMFKPGYLISITQGLVDEASETKQ